MTKDTMLYRQVSPSWVTEDGVASLVFKPSPKDEGKLSVYDGDQFDAPKSYDHFTSGGLKSAGVLGIEQQDCTNEGLPCEPDDNEFIGHVLVDYNVCSSKGQIEKKAKILRNKAWLRGWCHQPLETKHTDSEVIDTKDVIQ